MSDAWYLAENCKDPCGENRCTPNELATFETLVDLGIRYQKLDVGRLVNKDFEELHQIKAQMGYSSHDEVLCERSTENYCELLKKFFLEHIHEDEEVRLIVEGCGYFDVRDRHDRWIRIQCKAGDFILVPAGIYHRFSPDTADFTRAIRIFKENPKWIPVHRPCDENPVRVQYVRLLQDNIRQTLLGPTTQKNQLCIFPERFDATLKGMLKSMCAVTKDLLVLFFTGSPKVTTEKSWCPDCVAADPFVEHIIVQSGKKRQVYFLQCNIERPSYFGNPNYQYRTHPFIRLPSIPTVLVLEASANAQGFTELARQTDLNEEWINSL